jgi:osmoprotectant transport system ATP-binding protein
VAPGEICVLVGPSGCGKTTTLRMVNRLVEPTEGRVLIDGQDVAAEEVTALRRRIGYVIQQGGLFPHQTVAQNVGTVPRLLGWPEARIRERVDELLALVGLDPTRMRARYPGQLSGGERQRVGVARALAAEPPVLLMDEPFGAVDPIVRERLQDELLQMQRALGTTVLFVTHDIDEAIKLGDRVAVLQEGGRLAQYAAPLELLARPADEFVARFVGADRGLKRLALLYVEDVPPRALTTVPPDGPVVTLTPRTTLRDALARLLESGGATGVVVDAAGRCVGGVTLEAIAAALAAGATGAGAAGETGLGAESSGGNGAPREAVGPRDAEP